MRTLLAPAHLALTIVILIWDVVLAGRIAQNNQAPRAFQAICGLAALLVVPGLLFHLATSTIITGRAVAAMDWVWPAVLVLFAIQALYAFLRRLVNPAWGLPIAIYNLLIAIVGVIRFLVAHGHSPAEPLVSLIAAQSLAMVFAGGTAGVLASPLYLNVPMVSPAFPALHSLTASFRFLMSVYAALWCAFIIAIGLPRAVIQLRNYAAHARDPLRERPNADFAVGLKILPDMLNPPPAPAIRSDSALVAMLDPDALCVVVVPGISRAALDSLGKVLDAARHDSTTIVAAIGYRGVLVPELSTALFDEQERLVTVRRVMQRLQPDILLPAEDPYTSGERAHGVLPVARWESYYIDAVRTAKAIDPAVRIGLAASAYTRTDSALFAWANSARAPIDIVGFSLFPSPYVGGGIQADTRTADRWMRATPPRKPVWVFAAGGYPLSYGVRSQEQAIWEVLAWATDHPNIKGTVVYEAGDYGQARGLRAPDGRLRPATAAVRRAIRGLRESAR